MKRSLLYASMAVSLVMLSIPRTSLAWHPVGKISKTVQNITSTPNGAAVEADSDSTAIDVKTGDIIRYTITVSNIAGASSNGYNDLAFIEVVDDVPAGLELVGNSTNRSIEYTVDTLLPGTSSSKTIDMKVVATQNLSLITNKACFSADSLVKDRPQTGCDEARVRLNIPQTSSTSTVKPTPAVQAATTLPKTGPGSVFLAGFCTSILAYALSMTRRRTNIETR